MKTMIQTLFNKAQLFFNSGLVGIFRLTLFSDTTSGKCRICIFRNPMFASGKSEPRWLVSAEGRSRPATDVIINTAFDPMVEPQGNDGNAVYVCSGSLKWLGQKALIS